MSRYHDRDHFADALADALPAHSPTWPGRLARWVTRRLTPASRRRTSPTTTAQED
jgi:hypothetical protein